LDLKLKKDLLSESDLEKLLLPEVFFDEELEKDLEGEVGTLALARARV
jgi:hypothetical protein